MELQDHQIGLRSATMSESDGYYVDTARYKFPCSTRFLMSMSPTQDCSDDPRFAGVRGFSERVRVRVSRAISERSQIQEEIMSRGSISRRQTKNC